LYVYSIFGYDNNQNISLFSVVGLRDGGRDDFGREPVHRVELPEVGANPLLRKADLFMDGKHCMQLIEIILKILLTDL
jgi:hypothetical protein